jgi:hypothetical protein
VAGDILWLFFSVFILLIPVTPFAFSVCKTLDERGALDSLSA